MTKTQDPDSLMKGITDKKAEQKLERAIAKANASPKGA